MRPSLQDCIQRHAPELLEVVALASPEALEGLEARELECEEAVELLRRAYEEDPARGRFLALLAVEDLA